MRLPTIVLAACRAALPASVSALVLVVVAGQLPAVEGVVLVAAVAAGTALLRRGAGQGIVSRALHGTRPPTEVEAAVLAPAVTLLCRAALGPPLVRVRVQPSDPGLLARPWGHATVVVPRGLILAVHQGRVSHEQAAASLAHAAGTCRAGLTRGMPALALWCLPWLLLERVAMAAGGLRSSPLLRLAWHGRCVVASIAVAQTALGGHPWLAVVVAGIAAATYIQPALNRSWHRRLVAVGDAAVVDAGLGRKYAGVLSIAGVSVGLERLAGLTPEPSDSSTALVAAVRATHLMPGRRRTPPSRLSAAPAPRPGPVARRVGSGARPHGADPGSGTAPRTAGRWPGQPRRATG